MVFYVIAIQKIIAKDSGHFRGAQIENSQNSEPIC
jgi:hypothetical protein